MVHGNFCPASVTIEDGFGFEAVVPVKSPIKSSRWDCLMVPSGFLLFGRPPLERCPGAQKVGYPVVEILKKTEKKRGLPTIEITLQMSAIS